MWEDTLPSEYRSEFHRIVQKHIEGKSRLTGSEFKALQAEVGELANDLATSERVLDRRAGKVAGEINSALKTHLDEGVRAVDPAHAAAVRLERAGGYSGAEQGLNPRILQKAIKAEAGRRAIARGTAPFQDLVEAGQILREAKPSTMTGLGVGALGVLDPTGAAIATGIPAAALASAGATRGGARFALGDYDWQKLVREYLASVEGRALLATAGITRPVDAED